MITFSGSETKVDVSKTNFDVFAQQQRLPGDHDHRCLSSRYKNVASRSMLFSLPNLNYRPNGIKG